MFLSLKNSHFKYSCKAMFQATQKNIKNVEKRKTNKLGFFTEKSKTSKLGSTEYDLSFLLKERDPSLSGFLNLIPNLVFQSKVIGSNQL